MRYRDRECRFPGCGSRRFTEAHHVRWWHHKGRTDLDNLLLICSFHHRLVHEHGWAVKLDSDGTVRWFDPSGGHCPLRLGRVLFGARGYISDAAQMRLPGWDGARAARRG